MNLKDDIEEIWEIHLKKIQIKKNVKNIFFALILLQNS